MSTKERWNVGLEKPAETVIEKPSNNPPPEEDLDSILNYLDQRNKKPKLPFLNTKENFNKKQADKKEVEKQ